jgi:4-hydroxy-tetrahydrodipicolinate synthase
LDNAADCQIRRTELAQLAPIQFSGTSNTEYFGPMISRIFQLLQERNFDEATRLYWLCVPKTQTRT